MTKKTLDNILNKVKKATVGAALALGTLYSTNVEAQSDKKAKPEQAQLFGSTMIGGESAQVNLSEYFGSSFLSVKTDSSELGREFYPFETLRGIDENGRDTTGIVHWKTRNNQMEDLKSEVTFVPKKIEGKYVFKLKTLEESPLGLEISESESSVNGDVITGVVKYKSGKIEDVIRTVQFPGEKEKYYLFYNTTDSAEVARGKKTPFIFVKACRDDPIYFSGKEVFFEGEAYEFIAKDDSKLEMMQDKEGNSLIYDGKYLDGNALEIEKIRMHDRDTTKIKKGIPGHIDEMLEEGEPCPAESKDNDYNQKQPKEKIGARLDLRAGLVSPKGYTLSLSPQIKASPNFSVGLYGEYSTTAKSLEEKVNQEPGYDTTISVPAGIVYHSDGIKTTENGTVTANYGAGLILSYNTPKLEVNVKAGTEGQVINKETKHEGTEYLIIGGSKDPTSEQSYNSNNTTTEEKTIFENSPAKVGVEIKYHPWGDEEKGILKGLALSFNANRTLGNLGYFSGSAGVNYTIGK